MKLLYLSVRNFRGIPELSTDAQGRDVNIYGCNGAGKTTTYDAYLELLFGKDSFDRKDYDLIPHIPGSTDPDVGNGKEPTVEATFEYFGKTVKLKKIYVEEWPKKGEMKGQYAGSKMHYYVDDLEVKAGDFQKVVDELVDQNLFKLITNPRYFAEDLHWQARREALIKIAGELDVEMDRDLAVMLSGRDFGKFHALSKQNVKETQKKIDGLPYAIKEAMRLIPDELPKVADTVDLETEKAKLEEQLQTLKDDDSENFRRRGLAKIETEIAEARNKYTAALDAENRKVKAGIEKLENEKQRKTDTLRDNESRLRGLDREIDALAGQKQAKLSQWHEADDRKWTESEDCPTCGQKLPAEQIEAAKAKFNWQRSEDLERLKVEGLALKREIEENEKTMTDLEAKNKALSAEIATLSARIEKGKSMIKVGDFENTDEHKPLAAKIAELSDTSTVDTNKQTKIDKLVETIRDIQNRIDQANRDKLIIANAADQKKRVDELKAQEKKLNAELSGYEKAVYLCEQHVKAQSKALEQAVNGKFKIARFRMFAMQKNGEEVECCDVVYPNGSTNLSTGERLQVGIDIINTLTEFYGVDAPIWIDNAEGITKDIDCRSQVISLFVSKEDESLRVEVAE